MNGPDVASEETIETSSMIVEIPAEDSSENFSISHLSSDHCYTFKRGIKPTDLDRAKCKAAVLGESLPQPGGQQFSFILPKNPPPSAPSSLSSSLLDFRLRNLSPVSKRAQATLIRENIHNFKHRWLWQFMKELLYLGDPTLRWFNQKEGVFILRDQDSLASKWECYKKMHNMKGQVWRQMTYYFGWVEENKIMRQVPDVPCHYQFLERFYREKFLPYKFKPHTDLTILHKMSKELDCQDLMSRCKEKKVKVFCQHGCGSQFINKEACARHESVCPLQPQIVHVVSH